MASTSTQAAAGGASLAAMAPAAAAMGPIGWASLGVAAIGTVTGIMGNKEAASNAKDKAKHDAELMRAASEAQIDSILAQKDEASKQAVEKMSDVARAAAVQRARIITAAGEAGVAGASPSKQLLGSFYEEAKARGAELYNLGAYKRQANRDIKSAEAGLQVNLPKYQSTGPSVASQLLAGALQGLSIWQSSTPKSIT